MPLYEYRCPVGHTTDRVVPLAKAPGPRAIVCKVIEHRVSHTVCTRNPPCLPPCGRRAKRAEVNLVNVTFNAPGFTRRILP